MSGKNRYRHRFRHRTGKHAGTRYLLMIRLIDWKMSRLIHTVSRMSLKRSDTSRFPHITLYGGFGLASGTTIDEIRKIVEKAASRATHLPVTLSAWTRMQGRKGTAIGYHIDPSPAFSTMYREISHALLPITQSRIWLDRAPEMRRFHITIAYNMNAGDAGHLWGCLHRADHPHIPVSDDLAKHPDHPGTSSRIFDPEYSDLEMLRLALFRNGALAYEFDLPCQEWLGRAACFSPAVMKKTQKMHRHLMGYELNRPHFADQPACYVISDMHLGHENIIRYCRRPFSDAHEMDDVLVRNWNLTIRPEDRVYYLGDLEYHGDPPRSPFQINTLHGQISFIAGNHDTGIPRALHTTEISSGEIRLLLVHNPEDAPPGYPGWVIHGHVHNHDLCRFPFFNRAARRINVSAELTGYRPVRLDFLVQLIGDASVSVLRTMPRKKERAAIEHAVRDQDWFFPEYK